MIVTGEFAGGQFGSELKAGDLNDDGVDDLVISAPLASEGGKKWNGAVKILFGSHYKEVDIYGENEGDQLGRAITIGDFDGDKLEDIAIGSHNAYVSDTRPGKVYVFLGKNGLKNIAEKGLEGADFEISPGKDKEGFGLALNKSDFNNDGFDDLLVGAPFAAGLEKTNSGVVYGYLGSKTGLSSIPRVFFYGKTANERFGSIIESGDFNGDSYTDVVIGAYRSDVGEKKQSGKVYFYEGRSKPVFVLFDADEEIGGMLDGEWFGFSTSVGDVNADGFDDIAMTSFPYWGDRQESQLSIIYGGAEFDGKSDVTVSDPIGETLLGQDVLLRDVNGDNRADIVLGAPGVNDVKSEDEGLVYMIYSGGLKYKNKYKLSHKEADSFIYGENGDDWFGSQMEVLDINNDKYQDLVVSAIYADGDQSPDAGKVYVIFGNSKPFGDVKTVNAPTGNEVSRGELIKEVVERFDLKNTKASEITNCYEHKEFCLFNFLAMSSYDDVQLEPELILYPDVSPGNEYYEYINIATILGVANGYMDDENSPFNQDMPITRVQALKIILGASDLVAAKYKFELIEELGGHQKLTSQETAFYDVDAKIDHMWWYPRYINFALQKRIIEEADYFRPDDYITRGELDLWIGNTLEYLNESDEETDS